MSSRQRLGNRVVVVVAAAVGFGLGGVGLVTASQSSGLLEDSVPNSVDDSVNSTPNSTDDSADDTSNSTPNSTDDSADDTSNSTPNSTDDSADDTSNSTPNSGPGNSTPGQALPAAFTKTYSSAGGSITVTWNGTAFTLDSVNAAPGFQADIQDQRWDRIRVDFEGDDSDARIEVRLSDDNNTIRVRID